MQSLVSELSRFLFIIISSLYAYLGFSSFLKKEKRETFLAMPVLILLFHGTGFLSIYLKVQEPKVVYLYMLQLGIFLCFGVIYPTIYKNFSKPLFYHMNFLLMIGFVFVTRISVKAGFRQTVFAGLALSVSLMIPFLIKKMSFLRNMGYLYALAGVSSLLFVLIKASRIYGAKNWISLFGFRFQPSEFVKIMLIFMIASFLYVGKGMKQVITVTVFTAAMVLLLVFERDLGGALLFFVTFVVMVYYATGNKRLLALFSGGGILASVFGYYAFSHVRVRVAAFIDPWASIDDKGYQITQSLFGIGTGGWFGFGLFNGSPKSTPVVESDFIFSGLSEEFGLLFAFTLILIYLCTFLVIIFLTIKTKNEFHRHISVGCLTMYSFQVFLSIGGSIKFIPSTGVTLPLISTGGSSMISIILIFFVIQGLYISSYEGTSRRVRLKGRSYQLSYLLLGVFLSMMVYLTYFQFFISPKIINNAYNKRLDLYASNVQRGNIYSADGILLAHTEENRNGKSKRVYPYKNLYSHVIGRNANGKTGVESIMNYELFSAHYDSLKQVSERLMGMKNRGDSVQTTLDSRLQKSLDRAIGNHIGAGVIIEPETGKILALVSKPEYDPNTVKEKWEELSSLDKSKAKLVNRVTTGRYPPGSTFKILTALWYLREKKSEKSFSFDCKGIYQKNGHEISCANKVVHGKETLTSAFANSCNGAFSQIGLEGNKKLLHEICEEFLFQKELPFPLTTEKSSFVLKEDAETDEIMQTSIGQGKTEISPIHNALIISAIANGGVLMQPYLVDKIVTFDGKQLVKTYKPKEYARLLSKKENDLLTGMMKAVVKNGTAKKLSWLGYPIYGKTGTAEYQTKDGKKASHSWFVGFGERNGKRMAISILLEGEGRGFYSGTDAAYQVFSNWK